MKNILLTLALTLFITGCSIYKQDIQQGNDITPQMIEKLSEGMTQREVTRILGFPLINDPFHKDRWDYFYSKHHGESGKTVLKSLTLYFSEGRVTKVKQNSTE